MNTADVPIFKKKGFDSEKYFSLQTYDISKRLDSVQNGHLYLEIGGKLFRDPHAARVLPGFKVDMKPEILRNIAEDFNILFCINYDDILSNRQLSNQSTEYIQGSLRIIENIKTVFGIQPIVVINKIKNSQEEELVKAIQQIQDRGYEVYRRYYIDGYPEMSDSILSDDGYGNDEYIPVTEKLVIVTGSASNSGKMSTCLGQIYHESKKGMNSGYAKYETFPIWNLPLEHPVNLAYEAATADIGDRNILDIYHQKEYGKASVNYNRDVDAFKILKGLTKNILPESNLINTYKSPTDMGVSNAGLAITNDEVVAVAGYLEIIRRKDWYQELVEQKVGQKTWVRRCEQLEKEAWKYLKDRSFDPNLDI